MALPASGQLGGTDVSVAQFQSRIEDLRDIVAGLEGLPGVTTTHTQQINDAISGISSNLSAIQTLSNRIDALEGMISKSGNLITLNGDVEATGYIEA